MSVWTVMLLVWLLASLDATFVGFRDAAGRNPRVFKKAWFRRALLRGLALGQVASVVVLAWLGVLAWSLDATEVVDLHHKVGGGMVAVYLPYAVVVLGALSVYKLPHPDVSSLATVLVLGPLTLLRPVVILVGAGWGLWQAPTLATGSSVVLAAGLMLALEPMLGRRWRDRAPLSLPPEP